ncbi:MAG: hypothetical protein B9S33_11855 [Pedosphaera sp. Tous-C6FEB]|nr:MAG: hypothetical protein B9S33_11855 [Pedosphaera sp. Tous-C6FEB]
MVIRHNPRSQTALTFTEVLFVVVCVLVLVALAMTVLTRKQGGTLSTCQKHLRGVGLAFRVFSNDSDDRFPFAMPGSLAYKNETDAWLHFQAMSNELGSARVLLCPQDAVRLTNRADNFNMGATSDSLSLARWGNRAVSYFVGVDANETEPEMLVAGDRNLMSTALTGPILTLTTNTAFAWSLAQHTNMGYASLADGSVQGFTRTTLLRHLIDFPPRIKTNRLLLPLVP